jgi:CheY-like chemotaxis protein
MKSIPAQKPAILVVDDDEGLLLSIKATLVSAGLPEPALVSDSRRVLEVLRSQRFPLVLLDLMMPHMGGMEVMQHIKEEIKIFFCKLL